MATTSTSEAKAKVSLESDPFVKSAKAITEAAEAMSAAVGAAFVAAGAAVIAAFGVASVEAIVSHVKAVIDLGERMANAGHAANIAAGQFYLFNNAVEKGLSLKTVAGLLGENAEVLNRSASVFRDVAIKLWVVGEKIQGFWLGLVDKLAPVLSRLLDGALAVSLVSAGQAFGNAIAGSFEVIYQLAQDGKIWATLLAGFKIAFDYAGERLIWLAGLSFAVLKLSFSEAFIEGVADGVEGMWTVIKKFSEDFGEVIGSAIWSSMTKIVELIDGLLNKIDEGRNKLGLMFNKKGWQWEEYPQNVADRKIGLTSMQAAGGDNGKESSSQSFVDKLKLIFDGSIGFKKSGDLSKEITDFSETISGALQKYQSGVKDNPTQTFENNTRRQAFGADSQASIGAGGNVYLGLSVLDVQKSQLNELREINRKLDLRGGQTNIGGDASPVSDSAISRNLTTDVVTAN